MAFKSDFYVFFIRFIFLSLFILAFKKVMAVVATGNGTRDSAFWSFSIILHS